MNINELKKQIRSEFEGKFTCKGNVSKCPLPHEIELDDVRVGALEAFLDKVIERVWNEARREKEIDFSIDVRYEPDLIEMFNKFIKKWCGVHYPHLIDSDENDGEFIRERLRDLTSSISKE